MPRVLLTGFGPFGSHDVNPTQAIVEKFPSLLPIKNPFGRGSSEMSIEKLVLSVDEKGRRGRRMNLLLVSGMLYFISAFVVSARDLGLSSKQKTFSI